MEGNMQKVLYVEDNPLNMSLMHHIFKKTLPGILLLEAESAEAGLVLAEGERPDLIILDIGLPGLSGYEAMELLRGKESTKDIPVLAISAFAQPSDLDKAKEAGFAGYITKPFQVKPFTEQVKEILAKER